MSEHTKSRAHVAIPNKVLAGYAALFCIVYSSLSFLAQFVILELGLNPSMSLNILLMFFCVMVFGWFVVWRHRRFLIGDELWQAFALCLTFVMLAEATGYSGSNNQLIKADYLGLHPWLAWAMATIIAAVLIAGGFRQSVKLWTTKRK